MDREPRYRGGMIRGFAILLFFQGLGELVSRVLGLPIPGPVVGLFMLLALLIIRREVDPDLALVANGLTQHLGLLFVPAAVGVIVFLPQLAEYGVELMLALSLSVAASMATTALVLKRRERAGRDR